MDHEKKTPLTEKNGGHLLRNDIIFIAGILLVVAVIGLCFYLFREKGDKVVVTVDGIIYGTYSLEEDIVVEIRTGEQGEGLNVLVIKDGVAYVETANCPDGICAGHRPISREGESIVCLPNRVVITVHTEEEEEAPDIIV